DVQGRSRASDTSDYRRSRHVLIKASTFDQVVANENTTGFTTDSSTYVSSGFDTYYAPRRNETVIVLANAIVGSDSDDEQATVQLRKDQDGMASQYYRLDHGQDERDAGFDANRDQVPVFMLHADESQALPAHWYWEIKNAAGGANLVALGRNEDNTADKQSDMIIFTLSPPTPATASLTASGVTGPVIAATDSLTVSGVPVATGASDDFVRIAGDTMTGVLDMAGNRVEDTGVVKVQNTEPVLTVSGMLWFKGEFRP
ncbi:unnamed protein product, partial [marine sediment metagenome]